MPLGDRFDTLTLRFTAILVDGVTGEVFLAVGDGGTEIQPMIEVDEAAIPAVQTMTRQIALRWLHLLETIR